MDSTSTRRMNREVSVIRRSRVSLTEPSRLFSIGTTPSYASPVTTAVDTAAIVGQGIRMALGAYCSAAASVNVPAGPRYATRGDIIRLPV